MNLGINQPHCEPSRAKLGLKRSFDLFVAVAFLLALSPLMALITVAIKLEDWGPIFFVQERVGRGGRLFRCPKFRTMKDGARARGRGGEVADRDDRLTRVGRVLRDWTLDEIPQLWSVLKGDMSVVGPRPWVPSQIDGLPRWAQRRLDVRPGLAGWAWIHGRNLVPWEDRVRMDVWYVERWSLGLDAYILARALVLLFRRQGVYGAGGLVRDPDWRSRRRVVLLPPGEET